MKKISFACLLTSVLIGNSLSAQVEDTTFTAKQIIEKGTTGDLILGKEYKKRQLNIYPELLQTATLNSTTMQTSNQKRIKTSNEK